MTALTDRPPVPATSFDLLDRAYAELAAACAATDAAERYIAAHLAALRAGAALLAARSAPARRSQPRSVWELLVPLAPDLTEWAAFYAASARRRAAAERGEAIGTREADDLVRESATFVALVEGALGLAPHDQVPSALAALA